MKTFFVSLCALLLDACASAPTSTAPLRLSDAFDSEAQPTAYLWTSGWSTHTPAYDYASVTHFDGMGISAEYLPRPGRVPIQRVLLEIPAGEHELVILYQEHGNLKDAFCFGTCAFATERLQDTVMFTAEPDRIHVPFASDKGGCNWLWVEDWGDYLPGMETVDYGELSTKLNKPVVGGSSPGDGDCKSDETLE